MMDKKEIERRKIQEKMEQERAEILAHQEYMKKVAEEKEKGRKMVKVLLIRNGLIMNSWKN